MKEVSQIHEEILFYVLETGRREHSHRIARMGQEEPAVAESLLGLIDRRFFDQVHIIEAQLPNPAIVSLLSLASENTVSAINVLLQDFFGKDRSVKVTIVGCTDPEDRFAGEYLTKKTTLLFDLFNDGVFRGSNELAREALLDSCSLLPNRFLSADGRFIIKTGSKEIFYRGLEEEAFRRGADDYAAIDKFPSLLAVRPLKLAMDGNRIVPGAMVCDGVYIGKRNTLMAHVAINIAAFIGDENVIRSHVSIGGGAQVGNRNTFESFSSLEDVFTNSDCQVVRVGDNNVIGAASRIEAGIAIGNCNTIGLGVCLSLETPLKDCRTDSKTKGSYVACKTLSNFNNIRILANNALQTINGVQVSPGEYLVSENEPSKGS